MSGLSLVARFLTVTLLCAVLLTTAVAPAVGVTEHSGTQEISCPGGEFDPQPLEEDWEQTYVDALDEESLSDWTGGGLVQVGPDGSCSLAVLEGNSTTLTGAMINGTQGVVTGTLDLGANGTLALAEGGADDAVRISNSGPDFASTVVVSAANHSRTVSLSTGRFFEFAVVRTDGTTTVSLWAESSSYGARHQLQFENTRVAGPLDLRLDGRAFLSGLATGVVQADQSQTDPADEPDQSDDDAFEEQFPEQNRPAQPEQDSGQGLPLRWGLVLFFVGALEYYYARPLADLSEQIDSIGSTTASGEVEAAAWKFRLTQIGGVVVWLFGVFIIAQSVL